MEFQTSFYNDSCREQPNKEHLNTKFLSYEKLINAIEELETKGIISFDEFKKLSHLDRKQKYFAVPNYTMMEKAIIKLKTSEVEKQNLLNILESQQFMKTVKR